MKIRITSLNSVFLFQVIFLTFLGYYAILLVAINAGMSGFTRQITVPVRVLIILSLIGLLFLNIKYISINNHIRIFILFVFIFLVRIIYDHYNGVIYYLPISDIVLYLFSFCIFPFLAISSFRLNKYYIEIIFKSFIFSGFIFSILSIFLYGNYIGQVGRLSASSIGEEVISPLALSYSSTLLIGVIISYLIYNKLNLFIKIILSITLVLSIVPFFLGASRGSLFALFLPFSILFIAKINFKNFIQGIILFTLFIFGLIYLSESLGSDLLDRFINISSDIDQKNNSSIRMVMWENSFLQFQNNPFFGDKLGVDGFNGYYPHNIFLEVLQSTGIVGFIPFIILIVKGFKISFNTFKHFPQYSWVCVIFIQSIIQNMFSGGLLVSAWFWTSLALIFSLNPFLIYKERFIN